MEIECVYRKGLCTLYLEKYTCVVTSASITLPRTRVSSFNGVHLAGKSNLDVEAIMFNKTVVNYFPRGLHRIFPKLQAVLIRNCELKKLSHQDLIGLENLTGLSIMCNELKSLPDDLFTNMKKLIYISFYDNKLENLSSKLLFPILDNGLAYVNFEENTKINVTFQTTDTPSATSVSLEELMNTVDKNCVKPMKAKNLQIVRFNDKLSKGIGGLWSTGNYSDFTIICEDKKFRVHKNLLAIQSQVFAAMFGDEMKEKITGEMNIVDFTAKAVEDFLKYLYTGGFPDDTHAMELFAIAAKYEVPELKMVCEELILENLDHSNALEIFSLAHLYSSTLMKKLAFAEIKRMFPETIVNDNLMNDPERLQFLINAKRQYENVLNNINTIEI